MKKQDVHGELTDIEIEETSVVTAPANKRKFLFMKSEDLKNVLPMFKEGEEIGIEIVSNGTREGTILKLNGVIVPMPEGVWFSLYEQYDQPGEYHVACSYTQKVETDGVIESRTYCLSKEEKIMLNEDIMKQLKDIFGEEFEVAQVEKNDETISTLMKALEVAHTYKSEFPEDLAVAIDNLAKYALSGYAVEKEAEPETEETEKQETEKKEETETTEVDKSDAVMDGITKVTEAVEKLTTAISDLDKRLGVVEKSAGTRKSVDDTEEVTKSKDLFPSITL